MTPEELEQKGKELMKHLIKLWIEVGGDENEIKKLIDDGISNNNKGFDKLSRE